MFSWLAKRMLTHNIERLNAGDHRPTMRLYAADVRFRFPGDSSWAGEIRGRDELERWLLRMVDAGIKHEVDEVIVQGPPWRTTLCVRATDALDTDDGRVYENRYVIWGRIAWGKLREYEVYEDTQASKALDGYLEPGTAPRQDRSPLAAT
jgi:ketosteroid isomerase-like protein